MPLRTDSRRLGGGGLTLRPPGVAREHQREGETKAGRSEAGFCHANAGSTCTRLDAKWGILGLLASGELTPHHLNYRKATCRKCAFCLGEKPFNWASFIR